MVQRCAISILWVELLCVRVPYIGTTLTMQTEFAASRTHGKFGRRQTGDIFLIFPRK